MARVVLDEPQVVFGSRGCTEPSRAAFAASSCRAGKPARLRRKVVQQATSNKQQTTGDSLSRREFSKATARRQVQVAVIIMKHTTGVGLAGIVRPRGSIWRRIDPFGGKSKPVGGAKPSPSRALCHRRCGWLCCAALLVPKEPARASSLPAQLWRLSRVARPLASERGFGRPARLSVWQRRCRLLAC